MPPNIHIVERVVEYENFWWKFQNENNETRQQKQKKNKEQNKTFCMSTTLLRWSTIHNPNHAYNFWCSARQFDETQNYVSDMRDIGIFFGLLSETPPRLLSFAIDFWIAESIHSPPLTAFSIECECRYVVCEWIHVK